MKVTCHDCKKEIKGHEICVSMKDYKKRCPKCAGRYDNGNIESTENSERT